MSNWDDDDDYDVPTTRVAPIVASKGKWEGEDEDEDDIPVLSTPLKNANL